MAEGLVPGVWDLPRLLATIAIQYSVIMTVVLLLFGWLGRAAHAGSDSD